MTAPCRTTFEARWAKVVAMLNEHGFVTVDSIAEALTMTNRQANSWLHKRDCAGQLEPMRTEDGKRVRAHYVWPRKVSA